MPSTLFNHRYTHSLYFKKKSTTENRGRKKKLSLRNFKEKKKNTSSKNSKRKKPLQTACVQKVRRLRCINLIYPWRLRLTSYSSHSLRRTRGEQTTIWEHTQTDTRTYIYIHTYLHKCTYTCINTDRHASVHTSRYTRNKHINRKYKQRHSHTHKDKRNK